MLLNASASTLTYAYMLSDYGDPKIGFINELFFSLTKGAPLFVTTVKVLISAAYIVIRVYSDS